MGVLCLERRLDVITATVNVNFLPKLKYQLGIGQRPVAGRSLQVVALNQAVQIVPLVFRKKRA